MSSSVATKDQDTSVVQLGSKDYIALELLHRYSEGDPRVLQLNGAFNVGDRGMVEFIEVFKQRNYVPAYDYHCHAGKVLTGSARDRK